MADVGTQLRARWQSSDGIELLRVVLQRLIEGKPLTGIGLESIEGRIDLRGIHVPDPELAAGVRVAGAVVNQLTGVLTLRGVSLVGLDFSHARLPSLRLFDSTIEDSLFTDAYCRDWRLGAVNVARTEFRDADLRSSVLGAWHEGRGCTYANVDFRSADLRGLVSTTATYVDCDFSNARIDGIDFQSSSFVRCRFAGELRDVVFWDHGFETGKPEPNPMEDVDFSDAHLRFVGFRRLDLDRVRLPTSHDHLIVRRYRCVLATVLATLEGDNTPIGRRNRVLLERRLKWPGPNQEVGVFHVDELGDSPSDADALRDRLLDAEKACLDTHH